MKDTKCSFCGKSVARPMQGYCQTCYKYFVVEGKEVYPLPSYGECTYAPNGDCICPECGKAFRKLGGHVRYFHGLTTSEFFKKHGWHIRNTKASNKDYRKYMKDVQHPKTISINLLENGKLTRFNAELGNQKQIPTHSMKSRCANCACLVEDKDGDWYCDECQNKCVLVMHCPYAKEVK